MTHEFALEAVLARLEQKVDKLGSDMAENKGEMREAIAVLRTEIGHLVDERDRQFDELQTRLDDHETRLRSVEGRQAGIIVHVLKFIGAGVAGGVATVASIWAIFHGTPVP